MKKLKIIIIIFLVIPVISRAQNQGPLTQTVRGMVFDQISGQPLSNISIHMNDKSQITEKGIFVFEDVPIGRHTITVSGAGYETVIIKEALVGTGKELNLEIELDEKYIALDSVIVTPSVNKERSLNPMALAGAQMFSVEETNRFAGGMDDPARLVSSYAGVATPTVSNNGISIRGNAPSLLQWRVEGIEIPNPNHFADIDVLGGGLLSALSSNVLGNSDFFIGAFPAEYNNAISGVFDMQLRNGSSQQHQHTFQLGVLGIDLASEGPISKNNNASYLINYRYSTTGLISKFQNKEESGGILAYQDLNFKFNFPTKKAGTFSLWGVGLVDEVDPILDEVEERKYLDDGILSAAKQKSGSLGLSHQYSFNNAATSLHTSIAAIHQGNEIEEKFYNLDKTRSPKSDLYSSTNNFVFNTALNHRFSPRHSNKTGFTFTNINYDMNLDFTPVFEQPLENIINSEASAHLISGYTNSLVKLGRSLTLSAGLNAQYFTLNGNATIEPRASVRMRLSPKNSIALAYGLHSRMEKPDVYFVKDEQMGLPNKNLKLMKSHHFMFSYVYSIKDDMNLKIEPYFQSLYDVPVTKNGAYSILNRKDFYITEELVSTGKGQNYGVDLTFSKYLTEGMYYMFTASLFDSRYLAGDNKWYSTRYNRNWTTNALIGKEWTFDRDILSVNLKTSIMGGKRYTPVDEAATLAHPDKEVQYDETQMYSRQYSPMFIGDFSLSYTMNRARVAHEFALKTINATGQKEYLEHKYNILNESIEPYEPSISVFNLSYRIEF